MSDDLIEQLQRKLDYVERCAAANEKERNEARARLEQAERSRAHWRLTALMSRREGFRAGIEAAAEKARLFGSADHIAHDIREGVFPVRSSFCDALSSAIRALAAQKGDE